VPTRAVIAKDDPLVPVETYDDPAFRTHPNLRLTAVEHGGHLGFLSRRRPRFWLDGLVLEWLNELSDSKGGNKSSPAAVVT
jgi:predicted alpha/beta-fold hydrolase